MLSFEQHYSSHCTVIRLAVRSENVALVKGGPFGGHEFVEAIGEGLVHVVVESGLELEARRLPELGNLAAAVVKVKHKLRQVANQKQACGVGLGTRVERTSEVRLMRCVSLVMQHFLHAIVRVLVGKSSRR